MTRAEDQVERARREADDISVEETIALANAGIIAVILRYMREQADQRYVVNPEDAIFGVAEEDGWKEIRGWWTPADPLLWNDRQDRRWTLFGNVQAGYYLHNPDDPSAYRFTTEQSQIIDGLLTARANND